MEKINPENKCSHLFSKSNTSISITEMFEMQKHLQKELAKRGKGIDFEKATFKEKIDAISTNMTNLTLEFGELLERLPHKRWKTYTPEQLNGWLSEEHRLETCYELIDMWCFFLNIGLCLDIDGQMFMDLYVTKNRENLARQDRGY